MISLGLLPVGYLLAGPLAEAVGVEWTHLTYAPGQVSGTPDDRRVWATMVALAWLARHADESRDEWQLLAQKAEGWLSATVRDQASLARWRQAAEALGEAEEIDIEFRRFGRGGWGCW